MKVFLTGATGYVGHKLALTLANRSHQFHILVLNLQSKNIQLHHSIRVFHGDITQEKSIRLAMKDCEQVYHTAALVQHYAAQSSIFYEINVEGTRNVMEAALQLGAGKVVFTSTCGVIGPSLNEPMSEADPRLTGFSSDYDFSKFLAEKLVLSYSQNGLPAVIVSPSKVYGPGIETHSVSVNRIIKRFVQGKPTLCPANANYISNYVFIDDLVSGHILAMEKGENGEKYIVGGDNLTYTEFFDTIRSVSGTGGILLPVPENIARLYGYWNVVKSKITRSQPVFCAGSVRHIYCNKSFSSQKAIIQLGYSITPFHVALKPTIEFLNPFLCTIPAIQ